MNAIVSASWVQIPFQLLIVMLLLLTVTLVIRSLMRSANRQAKDLIYQVNSLLPQTQCGQCGYAGCRPYARAIINGAAINKCPPGGSATIKALAQLLNETVVPLDSAHGKHSLPRVAVIREDECIGCTKCIQACPVDAIIGAAKLMHTVIASECTGCDLCIEPCPVDCIDLLYLPAKAQASWAIPSHRHISSAAADASGVSP